MTGCPVKLPCSIKCRSKNEEVNFCSRGGPAAGQPPDRGQKNPFIQKHFCQKHLAENCKLPNGQPLARNESLPKKKNAAYLSFLASVFHIA